MRRYLLRVLSLSIILVALLQSEAAKAGYFEISANGAYTRFNNGTIDGEPSFTKTVKLGGGLAYRLSEATSIELSYSQTRNFDTFAQEVSEISKKYYIQQTREFKTLSLNLIIDFAGKGARFKPFIRGGGGFMIRSTTMAGTSLDLDTLETATLTFNDAVPVQSASADGGMGFKIYVADSTAIEITGTVYATDLDKPEIYLHYAVSGGLRFLF